MSVTEWEQRHPIYSQALEPAGQQQQGHYGQALPGFVCLRGSMCVGSQESAGVLGSADRDGDVNVYVRGGVES